MGTGSRLLSGHNQSCDIISIKSFKWLCQIKKKRGLDIKPEVSLPIVLRFPYGIPIQRIISIANRKSPVNPFTKFADILQCGARANSPALFGQAPQTYTLSNNNLSSIVLIMANLVKGQVFFKLF